MRSLFRKIKMDCNEKQQPLSLRIKKPTGESKSFDLNIISTEVYHGRTWRPCPSIEIGFKTAMEIIAFTGDESSSAEFIQELIPYAFIEGCAIEDQVMDFTDDIVLWSWQVCLQGNSTTYEAVCQAAQALLDVSLSKPVGVA